MKNMKYGPYGLPWSEIAAIPDGGLISLANLYRDHESSYGKHYDAVLLQRRGGKLKVVDKMHIDPDGNIIDP